MGQVQALLLDFNGTLSDDEAVLSEIYAALCEEHGVPLPSSEYVGRLAGFSDGEIFRRRLGPAVDVAALTAERVRRYRVAVADGSTVSQERRAAVCLAAAHVPVVIVTSAWRDELLPVLEASGIAGAIHASVCADDVTRHKPHPDPYLRACDLLGLPPGRAIAVEDTEAGVKAATGAGVRCAAVLTTMAPRRLDRADLLVPSLNPATVGYLLNI